MSTSPPPTPPARPVLDNEFRFKTINSPCEWIEDYHPGGYHPVILGDLFNNGQYKVIRKLGDGSYSTVWLARDQREARYVALKILVAEESGLANEVRMFRHLASAAPAKAQRFVTQMIGEFDHRGPNGTHKCLVFEPMGPSVNVMVEELPQFKPHRWGVKIRYPPDMARHILKQSLQALAFLHSNGVSHGDFQPGNMLFSLQDLGSVPQDELCQAEDVDSQSISPLVQRLDGKQDKWAPRYLCIAQPLEHFTYYENGFQIKLSDMGGAYFFDEPPSKPLVPRGLRPPELVLAGEFHKTLDIWSFGCLVFELITGQPLFCVPYSNHADDDLLLDMTALLGALPDGLFERWKASSLYFTPDRQLFNCRLGGVPDGGEPLMIPQTSMEESFDEAAPDIDDEEGEEVKRLIRRILQYDPAKRPSAADILLDPWFNRARGDIG